ncbi:unnamed protein product [Staurois parvus]|uniref:Uncharacterized protein n=1 Tax=Staurois parvus TaxID=386267 RepID=A0ABN9BVN8_9NEOB|nr:unnamed protein product [Staurois parvus]
MPAGSCTAWNMASSLMGRCPVTRPLEEGTILQHLLQRDWSWQTCP